MYNLTLSLGEISVLLRSEEQKIIGLSKEAFKGFISSNQRPTIKINVVFDEELKDINPYAFGNPHRSSVIKEGANIFIRGSVYKGMFDLKSLEAEIRQGISVAPVYLSLRFIVSVYLPMVDGFLVHSASVAKDEKAFLFSGPPQSGKSTIAQLSHHHTILSDDFSIIRKMNGKFCCFGSPFWGHVETKGENIKNEKGHIPIKGIYFLKQDDETYLRKLDKVNAVLKLIQNISVITKDRNIDERIIRLADEFTNKVSVNSLHFKLDNSFWRCIENG